MHNPIFIALDNTGLDRSINLISKLSGRPVGWKINDLWDAYGARGVEKLRAAGAFTIWADLKLKDIPNTVRNRVRQISLANVEYITVMADGGIDMMAAAVEARKEFLMRRNHSLDVYPANELPAIGTGIIAVTVLTSLSEEEAQLIYGKSAKSAAIELSRWAKLADVDIVVTSPKEVELLAQRRELAGMSFFTPGIRYATGTPDDQKRTDTPMGAVRSGATSLVVGRPITEADDPVQAFDSIMAQFEAAHSEMIAKK